MATVWAFASFAFFLVPYYLQQIKANFFYMAFATETGEFLASLIMLFASQVMDLRRALLLCCLVIAVGSSAMVGMQGTDGQR